MGKEIMPKERFNCGSVSSPVQHECQKDLQNDRENRDPNKILF